MPAHSRKQQQGRPVAPRSQTAITFRFVFSPAVIPAPSSSAGPIAPPAHARTSHTAIQVLDIKDGCDLAVKILSAAPLNPATTTHHDHTTLSPARLLLKRPADMLPTPPKTRTTNSPAFSDDDTFDSDLPSQSLLPQAPCSTTTASIKPPPKKKHRASTSASSSLTVATRRTSLDVVPDYNRLSSPDEECIDDVSARTTTSTKLVVSRKQSSSSLSSSSYNHTGNDSEEYQSSVSSSCHMLHYHPTTVPSTTTHLAHSDRENMSFHPYAQAGSNLSPAKLGVCHFCKSNKTGQWRRGPGGMRTLCNACGINWCRKVRAYARKEGVSIDEAEGVVGADETWFRRVVV
ncbi:hypothetical protein HDU98_010094 [Podochytrium sp. JEL0797]|nr:hypothetical protein HDU98_010094 [Podochytrium sp. JEL0797]